MEQLTKLDNQCVVPPDVSFPYRPTDVDIMNVTLGHPLKRKPLTTIVHNYTFWADLIFQPESRERGMLLIVEGTSRWCWCWPFKNKTAEHIADIIRKFIEFIDERITCLVTDGGNEWAGIPPLTEKYGFVWKRKNVALTGHGAMARLDRTVRTLRYYMEMIWLASNMKENEWYRLFKMAVWVHNNSSHTFSNLPPQTLIAAPGEMGRMRKWQYLRRVWNYGDFLPYLRIKWNREKGKYPVALPDEKFYVEVNKEIPRQRFRYKRFIKAPDRHLYNTTPRDLRYVVGNKFLLHGEQMNTEREPDERGAQEVMKITDIVDDDEDEEPTIVEMNVPYRPIRWKGLWDKNSDKLYALDQLLPATEYEKEDKAVFNAKMTKYARLWNGAKEALELK